MKKTLSCSAFCLFLLQAVNVAAETIPFDEIASSKLLSLSVANGVSADEVLELFEEFEGVSVFESKRMREAALEKIVADSSSYQGAGAVNVQILYLMPVSQFDFESSSFAVCIPRVMFVSEDLPLKSDLPIVTLVGAFENEVSVRGVEYKKRDGHSRVADVNGDSFHWVCENGDIYDRVEFTRSSLGIKDLSQAENFDADVSQVGDGFVTARFTCDLVSYEVGYSQLESSCQATKLELYSIDDISLTTPLLEGAFSKP